MQSCDRKCFEQVRKNGRTRIQLSCSPDTEKKLENFDKDTRTMRKFMREEHKLIRNAFMNTPDLSRQIAYSKMLDKCNYCLIILQNACN